MVLQLAQDAIVGKRWHGQSRAAPEAGGMAERKQTTWQSVFFLSSSCNMRFSHLNQIIYIMCFFPHITTGFSYFNRTCTYIHVVIFFPIVMIAYLSMRASNLGELSLLW